MSDHDPAFSYALPDNRDMAYVEHITTTSSLEELRAAWDTLDSTERITAFKELPREIADDFFLGLSATDQRELLFALAEGERRIWMRLLAPDDAADVIQHAPLAKREHLLDLLDPSTRKEVSALLAYKEDQAGGLMSPRFARLRPEMTVDEAITYLRRQAGGLETMYYAYAVDADQSLLGVVSFRDLFSSRREQTVRQIMRTRFVAATTDMDQEAVARLFAQHYLLAIPIVDAENRMQGIVTVDDIVGVVQREAGEDIQKIGGSEALDEPYLRIGFFKMVRKRGGWLAALFLGEMLTATAMGFFEKEIARAIVLAMFIPLIISSGGNSGSQATTLVIRAMALGEVGLHQWWRVIRREVGVGAVLGALLGVIGMVRILVWQAFGQAYGEHYLLVALTVAFSLLGVVLFGTITGSMLPFILRRVGVDPASASAPFVATLVDVTGLVIYFSIASVVLRGTLL
ncbi:MAG: Mg/Co/Ni transporter MgtE / domain protein [Bryobacterales bacterium]|nr:Mg/Co/Ni transporter MgtE / domain protein [Bryobacterales bacterium]